MVHAHAAKDEPEEPGVLNLVLCDAFLHVGTPLPHDATCQARPPDGLEAGGGMALEADLGDLPSAAVRATDALYHHGRFRSQPAPHAEGP